MKSRTTGDLPGVARPANLRAAFDAVAPMMVGIEEELMLLDAETLDLAPRAEEVLARVEDDPRFKPEMPAAQLEIVLPPMDTVGQATAALRDARADLAEAARGIGVMAGAGTHPFAAAEGELRGLDRYEAIATEYGPVARRQLVFGLHVHVAVRPAGRALAVYNALRGHLPLIAALAANAPYHDGQDTGLASVRPKISELLPRQGVPPALGSFEELEAAVRWAGIDPSRWWWEARLHPGFGTVETRVPDTQATVAETAAIAAFVHALVAWLAERHARGDELGAAPTWRIAENRWSACRHGLEGAMTDLVTGEVVPTRQCLAVLLGELAPVAERLGCTAELARVDLDANGAQRQRATGDPRAATAWLAARFLG